jgi:hypothetical protein
MIDTQEIIDICVANSYDLLTGKKSIEQILDSPSQSYFLWNVVEENLDQKVFDGLMDFMIKYYERCAVLLNIKINERVKYKQETRKSNRVGQ